MQKDDYKLRALNKSMSRSNCLCMDFDLTNLVS